MDKVDPKIFDRSSYSSTTISVFQIVGAYFVDVYYNHLYTEALKFKTEGKVTSVTEGYRHASFAFLTALDNKAKGYKPEHYNRLLQGINEYFVYWTTFSSLTLSDCIDKIVREFVPADYFASLNKEQKRNILRSVLIESIRAFTKIVIGEFLGAIIDNHDEQANVDALKEKMVDTFIMHRETMFHKFLDCRAGGKPDEKVDKKFAEKLRGELINTNQKCQALQTMNAQLTAQVSLVKNSAESIVHKYKLLRNKYEAAMQELSITREKLKLLEDDRSHSVPRSNDSMFEDEEPTQHTAPVLHTASVPPMPNNKLVTSRVGLRSNTANNQAARRPTRKVTKPMEETYNLEDLIDDDNDTPVRIQIEELPNTKKMDELLNAHTVPEQNRTSKPVNKENTPKDPAHKDPAHKETQGTKNDEDQLGLPPSLSDIF